MKPKDEHMRACNTTLPPAMIEAIEEIQKSRISCPTFSQLIREAVEFWLKALEK